MSSPASDDRRSRTGTIALVLAALSTLALLAAVVSAALLALGGDDAAATDGSVRPPKPDRLEPVMPGGQILLTDRRLNARAEVQAADTGWAVEYGGGYQGFEGGPDEDKDLYRDENAVIDNDRASYKVGWCVDEEDRKPALAIAGFYYRGEDVGDDVKKTNEDVIAWWTRVASYKEDNVRHHEYTEPVTEPYELGDGSEGYLGRSTITIDPAERGTCTAGEMEVIVLSFDAGDRIASFVVVRDLGEDQSLTDEQVDEILETVRKVD